MYDDRMQAHRNETMPHPERPERIAEIWAALNKEGIISFCHRVPARDALMEEIQLVHRSVERRKERLREEREREREGGGGGGGEG